VTENETAASANKRLARSTATMTTSQMQLHSSIRLVSGEQRFSWLACGMSHLAIHFLQPDTVLDILVVLTCFTSLCFMSFIFLVPAYISSAVFNDEPKSQRPGQDNFFRPYGLSQSIARSTPSRQNRLTTSAYCLCYGVRGSTTPPQSSKYSHRPNVSTTITPPSYLRG
jgi:hypothetical protein